MTFCTANRRELFVDRGTVTSALVQFQRVGDDECFAILAYCIVPDHVHLVVEGLSDNSDLQRFVKMAKQRAAYALWHEHQLQKVWQEGYHDWVVRPEQSVVGVIRYVLDNPVRKRLVTRWDEYQFSKSLFPLI